MIKIVTIVKKNSNSVNNSNNFKIGNSKENNLEAHLMLKQDKQINGRPEPAD